MSQIGLKQTAGVGVIEVEALAVAVLDHDRHRVVGNVAVRDDHFVGPTLGRHGRLAGGAHLDRLIVGGIGEECERSGRSGDGDDRATEHQAPGAAGAVGRDAPAHVLPRRIGTGLAARFGDATEGVSDLLLVHRRSSSAAVSEAMPRCTWVLTDPREMPRAVATWTSVRSS